MRYFDEIKKSMNYLAKDKKTIFLGQAVNVPGTAMHNTLKEINKKKLLEIPVAEEMQMGMSLGLALEGYIPISIYPRWNFLLLATNQLVNHLDKISEISNNKLNPQIIIRTAVGSIRPLDPQSQHKGDFTEAYKMMCKNIDFYFLKNTKDIFKTYKKVLKNKKKISLIVEVADFYNEK
jgi:pyruvate/2-oxoglutarate/acetoin dehydrogenase E1 component